MNVHNNVRTLTGPDFEKIHKGLILLTGSFDGLFGKLFFKNLTDEVFALFRKLKTIFDLYIKRSSCSQL